MTSSADLERGDEMAICASVTDVGRAYYPRPLDPAGKPTLLGEKVTMHNLRVSQQNYDAERIVLLAAQLRCINGGMKSHCGYDVTCRSASVAPHSSSANSV
jgi:hypothetical protein